MNFVKWMRKNNRKIMTIVVIVIMVAFVGGVGLKQLLMRRSPAEIPLAFFGEKGKITNKNLAQARNDLTILQMISANEFLMRLDYKSQLLAQLLFPDSKIAAQISDQMKQAAMQGKFQVTNAEIDKFFAQTGLRGDINWLLLNAEAKKAGCYISPEQAKGTLKQMINVLSKGQYSAGDLVEALVQKQHIPEEEIIAVFADLLAIRSYAQMVTGNENVTINEIKATIGRNAEKIDAEFIKIPARPFVDDQPQPTQEKLTAQFDQYKNVLPGDETEENPYGFGYKLSPRVELEYLIVSLADIRKGVSKPTQEEMEEFYRRNSQDPRYAQIFKYEEKIDPTDPESETIEKTRTYAEVMGQVKTALIESKTAAKANMIMNDAIDITEAGFVNIDLEKADSEKLKEFAGDYSATAAKLSDKFDVKVSDGKTGLLSIQDIAADRYLGQLILQGQTAMGVRLEKIVFAVDELQVTKLGRFDVAKPRMWENIGPMNDRYGSVIALIRVTDFEKEAAPADINTAYNATGVILDSSAKENIFAVKDAVNSDCKLLDAMTVAKNRAGEIVKLVKEKGWDDALAKYNETHAAKADEKVQLDKKTQQPRYAQKDIKTAKAMKADNPDLTSRIETMIDEKKVINQLYSLLPEGETEALNTMAVLELKAIAAYCVVKNVSKTPATLDDYKNAKGNVAFLLDSARSDSAGITHYLPDNITKRMNYRIAEPETEDSDDTEETTTPDKAKQND